MDQRLAVCISFSLVEVKLMQTATLYFRRNHLQRLTQHAMYAQKMGQNLFLLLSFDFSFCQCITLKGMCISSTFSAIECRMV